MYHDKNLQNAFNRFNLLTLKIGRLMKSNTKITINSLF